MLCIASLSYTTLAFFCDMRLLEQCDFRTTAQLLD